MYPTPEQIERARILATLQVKDTAPVALPTDAALVDHAMTRVGLALDRSKQVR